jgi:hypothetical protein
VWAHIAVAALVANAVPYLLFAVAAQTVNSLRRTITGCEHSIRQDALRGSNSHKH